MDQEITESYDLRILRSLRQIIRAVDKYSHKLNIELGLTTPQLLCLDVLAKAMNPLTLSELAYRVNLGGSTVNGIVDRLESKQYLLRRRSNQDRRQVFVELTPAGAGVVAAAPPLLQEKFSVALEKLPGTEQKRLTEAIEQLVKLMEVDEEDASPNLFNRERVEPE